MPDLSIYRHDGLIAVLCMVSLLIICFSGVAAIGASAQEESPTETGTSTPTPTPTETSTEPGDSEDNGDEDTSEGATIGTVDIGIGDSLEDDPRTDTIQREISPTTRVLYVDTDLESEGKTTVILETTRTTRVTLTDGMSGYNNGGGVFVSRTYTLSEGVHKIEFPLQEWNGAMALTISDRNAAHGFNVNPPRSSPFKHLNDVGLAGIIVTGIIAGSYPVVIAWRREQKESEKVERVL